MTRQKRKKMMSYPKWFYHPTKGAELGNSAEGPKRYKSGWCDTPDDFPPESSIKDLSNMDKSELEAYAKEKYGVDLDRRKSVANMKKEVNLLGG